MEAEPTDARKLQEYELNKALEEHEGDDLDGLSMQNQRLARIQEYEEAAVSRSDPFAAMIGVGNADLQRLFEQLSAAVLNELDGHPPTLAELREVEPEIRLLLKLRNATEIDLVVHPPDDGQQPAASAHRQNGKGLNPQMQASKRDLLPKRWMTNG